MAVSADIRARRLPAGPLPFLAYSWSKMAIPRLMMLRLRAGIRWCLAGLPTTGFSVVAVASVVVVLSLGLSAGPTGAQTSGESLAPAEVAPEIAIVVDGLAADEVERPLDRLRSLTAVSRVTWDRLDDESTVFYLSSTGSSGRSAGALGLAASAELEALLPEAEILVGGSGVVDDQLAGRYRTGTVWTVLLAAAIGAAIGSAFGAWKRIAVTSVALAAAVVFAASLGAQIAGPFNGTLTTTTVPGALAGLVAGTAVALRLLIWFRHDFQSDGATAMRTAVADLVPELALVGSGLAVTAFIVEFLDPGRSPLTVIAVSALAGVLVVLAIMTPTLAVIGPSGPGRLPLSFPDGRDFPLLVVTAILAVLLALGLFAFARPTPVLIGGDALDDEASASVVSDRLVAGDPTEALVAVRPTSVSPADFVGWTGAVVERPEVAWIDTTAGRLTSTGPVEVDENTLLAPPGRDEMAVIVPSVDARSAEGQELVARLTAIPLAGGPADFEGEGSEAARVVGSRSTTLTALVFLSLVAGGAILVMTQNRALAVLTAALRLIGGGATLGVLGLMISDVTVAESVTALGLLALGLGLFELEFLRPVPAIPETQADVHGGPVAPGPAGGGDDTERSFGATGFDDRYRLLPNLGQNAGMAIATLAPAALLLSISAPLGGGPGTGQFGLALLAAVIVEVLIGLVLLRPALLGQRAAYHSAVRPVRVAMHSGIDLQRQKSLGAEDPAWRRTVGDLLQSEFRLQSEPGSVSLDTVFVPDTPLYKQAAAHHANLAEANLRIVGRSPQLRTLKTVSSRSSVTLTVTVDHPARQLVSVDGTVVGVRKPERRSGVLWLSPTSGGVYRIAESVELGSVSLPEDDTDPEAATAEPARRAEVADQRTGDPEPAAERGADGRGSGSNGEQRDADGAEDPAEV